MFEMQKRRAIYVYMRGLKQVGQLKKFGDIAYISNKMNYVALYVNDDDVEELTSKLKKYRFVKTVKESPRPDIDPDLGDLHDDVFFEAYDKGQDEEKAVQETEKPATVSESPKGTDKSQPEQIKVEEK